MSTVLVFSATINLVLCGCIWVLLSMIRKQNKHFVRRIHDLDKEIRTAKVTIGSLSKQRRECRARHGDGGIEHLPVSTTREQMVAEVTKSLLSTPHPSTKQEIIDRLLKDQEE